MKLIALAIALLPGFLKKFVLRTFYRAHIASDVRIGFGTVILAKHINLERGVRIGMFTYIRVDQLGMRTRASIGSLSFVSTHSLLMGPRSTIASQVTVAGDHDENGTLKMGMYAWIFQHCYINVTRPVELGNNVGIGGGTYIFTHGYWLSKLDGFPVGYGPVSIGDDTWLPWGCFIMPGVSIGKGVIVGARSLVTKSVPDHALVAGAPAKIIRERSNKDMSREDKRSVFDELVHDYARHLTCTLAIDQSGSGLEYKLSNGLVMNVCDNDSLIRKDVFNICWSSVSDAHLYSCMVWSLADYKSSSEEILTPAVVEFLLFSRRIGLRYYPVDEV